MPNKTLLFSLSLIILLINPLTAEGIDLLSPLENPTNPLECDNIFCVIDRLINFLIILAFGIAPIIIITAGYCFITSMGDPEKIITAKKLILYTLIGLIIIICAKSLVFLFQESLDVKR
ncbi:MAG: pilin [Candidatus Pacebacteria bacterium]|nr:pilin [Candidatus Paceibacterota bacterium]